MPNTKLTKQQYNISNYTNYKIQIIESLIINRFHKEMRNKSYNENIPHRNNLTKTLLDLIKDNIIIGL